MQKPQDSTNSHALLTSTVTSIFNDYRRGVSLHLSVLGYFSSFYHYSRQEEAQVAAQDEPKSPLEPVPPTTVKKRPRLDLTDATGDTRDRKRGKSMFGILLGTLNKAKSEDKQRNASEAVCVHDHIKCYISHPFLQAKKRQMIEQRLQNKLKKETESVRRAEEAKKDKTTANRKEEELQLKDSIV